jgi:epoxyqueuosine reductase QueG
MGKDKNYNKLKEIAFANGMMLFGVANVSSIREEFLLPKEVAANLPFGISIGYVLSKAVLDTIVDAPNQLYFFHYQRVNVLLDETALKLTAYIQSLGYYALPIPASQIIDWERQRAQLSHKKVALLAGLGWLGRNNLVVSPLYGSQVRLATVLTNLPLLEDKPIEGGCGACNKCISACPAKAIKERVQEFDALKCFEQLKEFKKKYNLGQYICGLCVKVCCAGSKNQK